MLAFSSRLLTFFILAWLPCGGAAVLAQVEPLPIFSAPGGAPGTLADQPPAEVVKVKAEFTPAKDGQPARLFVTAEIEPGWHIYSITQKKGGPIPTTIKLAESANVKPTGEFTALTPPEVHSDPDLWEGLQTEEHHTRASWYAPIELAPGVNPKELVIDGTLRAMYCRDSCYPAKNFKFQARLGEGLPIPADMPAVDRGSSAAAGALPGGFDQNKLMLPADETTIATYLLFGFLGGLILNVMPCVLPVVGLKILSFVEQSRHDRRRSFMLNLWFSLGLASVFMILATLPVLWQAVYGERFNWGQQFGNDPFNITMTGIMFAMALSLLGVWEIPIPGFLGTGRTNDLAAREGAAGAFSKGVITTLLATPCSGPFWGAAVGWALAQPWYLIYAVFGCAALGMASPYLLIGAFPKLIRWLPKPGAWMETFKQVMGFVLLGSVAFFLSFISPALVVPTVLFLFGLWAALWWIARTPLTAELTKRLTAWGWGLALGGAVGLFAFQYMARESALDWQPFSKAKLTEATTAGNTVMVDFTANWCLNCKLLEAQVLNTPEVRAAIAKNKVLPLVADYTYTPNEITRMLESLQSAAVPVLAIFPAGNPNQPIIFRGWYTQRELLDALARAGPSTAAKSARQSPAKTAAEPAIANAPR